MEHGSERRNDGMLMQFFGIFKVSKHAHVLVFKPGKL